MASNFRDYLALSDLIWYYFHKDSEELKNCAIRFDEETCSFWLIKPYDVHQSISSLRYKSIGE